MKYIATQQMTLLEALTLLAPESSKTTLRSWIRHGRARINDRVNKDGRKVVRPKDVVVIAPKDKLVDDTLKIVYEDSHIVVIDKPAGLLSVASNFEKEQTAHALLKKHYKPRIVQVVHRLDQDTSGIMIFALSDKSYEVLKTTFEKHEITRSYLAIVEGVSEEKEGTWESYLYEDNNYHVHDTQNTKKGKLAVTHYKRIKGRKKYSLMEFTLETGRKNQIRVQCQKAGHPVLGDKKYGAKSNMLRRLCLHAQRLDFQHPITKKMMRFFSPMPDSFNRVKV